ncbi:hypothetical protein KEM56_002730, partial [Ascosphaera pollenicola]
MDNNPDDQAQDQGTQILQMLQSMNNQMVQDRQSVSEQFRLVNNALQSQRSAITRQIEEAMTSHRQQ